MSPYETIRAKYEASEHDLPWEAWEDLYKRTGFVFATPDFFAMGSAGRKGETLVLFGDGEKDTWYIFAFAGDMAKCWSILPYELPWIAFERIRGGKRELAFYRTEDLRRHTPRTENDASILAEA